MLSERSLIIISLSISLTGLFFLLLLYYTVDLPLEHLEVVDAERDGEVVRVRGEVLSVRNVKNVTLLTLGEVITRKGVIFDPVNVSAGIEVEIEGEIAMYEGEAELVIRSLEVVG